MNPEWRGSLSIGVVALAQDQVISVSKAKKLPGQSFVISTSEESTILYIGGKVGYLGLLSVHHVCEFVFYESVCVCAFGMNNASYVFSYGIRSC